MLVITSAQPGTPTPDEIAQGAGEVSTVYLSHSGCAVKRVPGVWVSAAGKLWQLSTTPVKLQTGACPGGPDEARPAGEGGADRVELTAADAKQTAVSPPKRASENEYQETTKFVASIATTLYFKTTTYVNFCGAHGATTSRYFAHDLLGVKGRYFSEGPTDENELLEQASKLFKSDVATNHPFRYTTTLPYYADGALHFIAQLTAGSTHTESDGLSGPYERSVFLPTRWLGVNYVYVYLPPPPLATAVASHNVRVYGWSMLGAAGLAPTSRYKDFLRPGH